MSITVDVEDPVQQTLEAKRGEIEFRGLLFRRQVEGAPVLPEELDSEEMLAVARARMEETVNRFSAEPELRRSPFLEIGAERGQRAAALTERLGLSGIAADISLESLRYLDFLADRLGLARLPLRVCCDVLALPFLPRTFPLVFCYQTLHHFPSLPPVIAEVHRVSGGSFLFAEEPLRQAFRLPLWTRRAASSAERPAIWKRLLELVCSRPRFPEEDYGICENHGIGLSEWLDALAVFDGPRRLRCGRSVFTADPARATPRRLAARMVGGAIGGWVSRADRSEPGEAPGIDPASLLRCPSCVRRAPGDPGPLSASPQALECPSCGERYPISHGIPVLIPAPERSALYPGLDPAR